MVTRCAHCPFSVQHNDAEFDPDFAFDTTDLDDAYQEALADTMQEVRLCQACIRMDSCARVCLCTCVLVCLCAWGNGGRWW